MVSTIHIGVNILDSRRIFNLTEIVKIFLGIINRHFVIHLVEKKIVKPFRDAKGRGKSRGYSYLNVLQIGVFIELTKFKLSWEKAAVILSIIEKQYGFLEEVLYVSIIGYVGEKKDDILIYGSSEPKGKQRHVLITGEKEENDLFAVRNIGALLPGEGLIPTIDYFLKNEPIVPEKGMACCYIVNIRNIRNYIDRRIKQI